MPPPETPRDLFDLLRAARDPETGVGFSPPSSRPGRDPDARRHETTAVTLFWATILLAEAPEEQQWLAEEAAHCRDRTRGATSAMACRIRTRAVVNETLRLFPSVFTLVRETIKHDRIGAWNCRRAAGDDRAVGSAPSPQTVG